MELASTFIILTPHFNLLEAKDLKTLFNLHDLVKGGSSSPFSFFIPTLGMLLLLVYYEWDGGLLVKPGAPY